MPSQILKMVITEMEVACMHQQPGELQYFSLQIGAKAHRKSGPQQVFFLLFLFFLFLLFFQYYFLSHMAFQKKTPT